MTSRHILLAIMVAFLWGGNFVAARLALDVLPPFWLLVMRFVFVAALLIPFHPKPPAPLKDILALSVILGTLHFSLMFGPISMGLDVSSAVISSQLGVPFSCLLGSIIYKDAIGRWRALGILIALIGVVIICGTPRVLEQYWQFMLVSIGAFAWACGNMYIKKLGKVNILALLGWLSLFSIPQLLALSWFIEEQQWQAVQFMTFTTWMALLYTVIFSTIISYGVWYSLLSRFPVSHVVPYSLLVPVFGLGAAQWFFDEPLSWQFMIGGSLTIAGVAVIMFRKPDYAK